MMPGNRDVEIIIPPPEGGGLLHMLNLEVELQDPHELTDIET
jgi:hypothetical protein